MKNNEYNIVKITNDKNTFEAEYTNAQKVEYSFQSDNKNPIKDELNDNSTINDKVEDNVFKFSRKKEKKKEREDAEKIESSTSSSSAASSSASSAAGGVAGSSAASAAGASAAAASSGGIAAVVAATTVAVVSVGAIVGVNVINPVQEVELATFLTSEISPNSIDFSFSMPSRLLMYQEDGGQDAPISEKNVVFTIANGSGFNIEEYLMEYEEYDEEHFIYYGHMGGLTPDTSYALTVSIKEENPDKEAVYQELGKRTFFTQAIPVTADFKFETIEASTSRVNFSFVVSNTALEYTPGETDIPVVNATITNNFGYEDTISIERLTEFDEYSMIGSGEFSALTPSTTYTITVSAELESGYRSLGYTSFTTENAVTFDTVEVTHSSVNFSFIVDNEAVEYDPSLARMPAIQATISDGNDFYDEMWIEQISTYDDSNLMGSGNFTGLSANTEYTITLSVSLEQELRTLGSTTFTTSARPSSGFSWGIFTLDVEETVLFRFYVKSEYIGFVEGGPTPNCIAVVSKDGQEVKRSTDISYSTYEYSPGACAAEGTINGLDGSTTYELTIYFVNGQSEEALGDPKEFTTKESSPTFYFEDPDTYFVITDNSIAPVFSIKANEVEQSATSNLTNIFMEISDGVNYSDSYNVPYSEFSTGIDASYLVYSRNHVFEGLNPGTTYTISVRNGTTDVTYGSVEVTTTGTYTGFSWGTIETTPSTASITFNISSTYLDYESDPTAAVSSLYIDVNIGTQKVTSAGMDALTPGTGDNLVGKATASGLTPGTTYTLTLYRMVGSDSDSVAIGQPKTIETDEVAFNGATIPTEVSFYSHEFTITLDFVDDPSNPQYDDLSLQFYDEPYDNENKYALGSSITLASITTEQTLLIPSTQDGGESYFEFDFDNIGSYVITANQAGVPTEVYHDDISFTDTDDPGVVNGLESDYLIAVDASTGDFTLPVKLLYTDDYDKLRSFYVELSPTDGVTPSISAGASKEEDYQNLTYTGDDASSVITYIQNAGADGAEFNVKIYNFDDQQNPIWPKEGETVAPVYIKVADTNIVYGGKLYSTDLSQDSTSVQFGISYVAPVSTPTNPQIKFIDSSDSSLVYSYDFNFENYPTIDMINPSMSTGSTINDYASLKAAFEGKTFTVVISYYDGTTTTTKTIQTGVSFTFA